MNSKSVSQIFNTSFQTGDINIFVLCGVFFSRYQKLTWQSIKGKLHHWQKRSAKLFVVQNYTEKANGHVLLTVENV